MAIPSLPKLNFSVPLSMTAALPVEYNAYFNSYEDAVAAAQTAEAPGSTNTVYYFGQKIVVVTESSADLYLIQPDKTLKGAGSVPVTHNALAGRDAADAHPISAITELEATLEGKLDGAGFLTNLEIQAILDS